MVQIQPTTTATFITLSAIYSRVSSRASQVSTTCGSGWVRVGAHSAWTHPLPQVVLT